VSSRNKKHKQNKKDAENDLIDTKEAFVASIMVIIGIAIECIGHFLKIPITIRIVIFIICVIGWIFVLSKKHFNKTMQSKVIKNFINFITVISNCWFLVEILNFQIEEREKLHPIVFGITAAVFLTFLFLREMKRKKVFNEHRIS
jgi:hypothetical protein